MAVVAEPEMDQVEPLGERRRVGGDGEAFLPVDLHQVDVAGGDGEDVELRRVSLPAALRGDPFVDLEDVDRSPRELACGQ